MSFKLYAGAMISSPDEKGVIATLVGEHDSESGINANALMELRSGATKWTIFKQKLIYGRTMPVILSIPNNLTSCGKFDNQLNIKTWVINHLFIFIF